MNNKLQDLIKRVQIQYSQCQDPTLKNLVTKVITGQVLR